MIRCLVVLLLAGPAWARVQDITRLPGASGSDVVELVVNRIKESSVFADDIRSLRNLAFEETRDGADPKTYRPGYDGGIWQIDRDEFDQIKKSSTAAALFPAMKSQFAIDWNTVQWSDLRKPLYSGLAAALYLSTINEIVARLKGVDTHGNKIGLDDSPEKTFTLISYPPDVPGVCSAGPPSFQAHPQDATKFLLCRHGEAWSMFQCIPQYVYNPSIHNCIPKPTYPRATRPVVVPTRASAPPRLLQTEPVPDLVPSTGKLYPLMSSTAASTPRPHIPHQYKDANNVCIYGQSDFYPVATDRHSYIHCDLFGNAIVTTCPDNKIWHQEVLTCILDGLYPSGPILG